MLCFQICFLFFYESPCHPTVLICSQRPKFIQLFPGKLGLISTRSTSILGFSLVQHRVQGGTKKRVCRSSHFRLKLSKIICFFLCHPVHRFGQLKLGKLVTIVDPRSVRDTFKEIRLESSPSKAPPFLMPF